jgi:catechol 2,3-dioxygenase
VTVPSPGNAAAAASAAAEPIDPRTELGAVALTVADLDRAEAFYERSLGLRRLDRDGAQARLGVEAGRPLVELVGDPDAPPRPRRSTGLFHLALLVPSRADLAVALRRVVDSGVRLDGASDHLVSEALYLHDPEGNGIEIYRDRPREQWPYRNGMPAMATEALDLDAVMAEEVNASGDPAVAPPGSRIGHVHLNVADLDAAEAFYAGALGFEVTVRGYPGALFVAAGGYHHHVGLNTWAGEGAPPPPAGARGLRSFEILVPGRDALGGVEERAGRAGVELERRDGALAGRDPSANGVVVRAAAAQR